MPRYTIILDPDSDGIYTVTVPALPGVVTQGDTIEEALSMARDAIELHLNVYWRMGSRSQLRRILPSS